MTTVSFDRTAVIIDGKRRFLCSGAVHYPRSTPQMWPAILRESKAAGINTIETYVFWNLHERERGRYDFSERLDLRRFIQLCHEHGMWVILRIGPYICSETTFGGFPPWMLQEPGLETRTDNEPFKRHVMRWCRVLMAEVGDLQATRGGPLILAQLENEYNQVAARYGDAGKRYLQWVVDSAPAMGLEVPLVMCDGAAPGALEGINNFAGADLVPDFLARHPGKPLLWTEAWSSWYDVFGHVRHHRDAQDIAYELMRFVALGGSGFNHYMWHGGTNLDRMAMYLCATTYDFDAPLDEYGLPTTKSRHLGRLHEALVAHEDLLLSGERPQIAVLEAPDAGKTFPRLGTWRFALGDDAATLAVNAGPEERRLEIDGVAVLLPAASAVLVSKRAGAARVACSSRFASDLKRVRRRWAPSKIRLAFKELLEPLPEHAAANDPRPTIPLDRPASMLPYTGVTSDFAWYACELTSRSARTVTLALPEVHDVSSLFVNRRFVGMLPTAFDEAQPKHWRHEYRVKLKAGVNRIAVLASSLGLVKGDWQLDAPMITERKGLIGDLEIDGRPTALDWRLTPGLLGEADDLMGAGGRIATWKPLGRGGKGPGPSAQRLRWFRAEFDGPDGRAPGYALDIGGLFKGQLWLNGRCLGRYLQAPATACPFQQMPWNGPYVQVEGLGEPAQRHYHLPKEWLGRRNALVIFEETDAAPKGVAVVERR